MPYPYLLPSACHGLRLVAAAAVVLLGGHCGTALKLSSHSPAAPGARGGADVGSRLLLVPYPAAVKALPGGPLVLTGRLSVLLGPGVVATDPAISSLQRSLDQTAPQDGAPGGPSVGLDIREKAGADPESYELVVNQSGAQITAPASAGLAYGARTLEQLVLTAPRGAGGGTVAIPAVAVSDAPAFKWRGLHLDVSRHFFPAADVMRLLDDMAAFKLNRFHWHLTDDQGWRVPIPGYPLLTTKGSGPRSVRGSHVTGPGVEGYYTEEDIKAVVAHAAALHIQVMPEVDVPGHAAAAITSYPELGNLGFEPPPGPVGEWGQFKWTLSPTQEAVKFMEAIVDTLTRLFPDAHIHVGGDEAPTTQWDQTSQSGRSRWLPDARAWLTQSFFNRRLAEMLHSRGKVFVGWDETQKFDGLPQNATVVAWRGDNEMRKAIAGGRKVIQANLGFLYFDFVQGPQAQEPKGQSPTVTLETTFQRCHAFAQEMKDQPLVLGAQGQLWTEYITSMKHLEYMAFPRTIALAECVWTPPGEDDGGFGSFRDRLEPHLRLLEQLGVNFRRLDAEQ